jgi:molybdenum cofactor cytidylyltransferase
MGQPKQLLSLGGKPLLVHAVEAILATPVWPVVVVLGANAEQIRPTLSTLPVLAVENEAWAEGMASSVRTGIATLAQFSRGLDAALLALCDQPKFSANSVHRLLDAYRAAPDRIVAARYSGQTGAPALFGRRDFNALATLTGEQGARVLLKADPSRVTSVDLPELAFDLDTPEDYAALQSSQL